MHRFFTLILFVGLIAFNIPLLANTLLTSPPKGWECIEDPSQLPQKVKVIFIGSAMGKSQFSPSINVACEETTMFLDEYVTLAKAYHQGQSNTKCTQIGTLDTASGPVQLLQIDRPSQWGDVRFIQAVLVHEAHAYVVTATCLKEDFGKLSKPIFAAIRSLTIPNQTILSLPTK